VYGVFKKIVTVLLINTNKKMSRYKILHVISGLSTGGAEMALLRLLLMSDKAQYNIKIISLTNYGSIGKKIEKNGFYVLSLKLNNYKSFFPSLLKLKKLLNNFKPDLIQGWMYHGNLMALILCVYSSNSPALVWNVRHSLYKLSHEKFLTQLVIKLNRFFSNKPNALIFNSQLSLRQHKKFGFLSKHVNVIPNGIDIDKFSFSKKYRKDIREELKIPQNFFVVGHIARFHPMKNHTLFLKVAVEIARRFSKSHFILVGKDIDYNNYNLKKHIPIDLRYKFHLLGERSDIHKIICGFDVFCLTSSWGEGFPNVLVEALSIGIPCVSTDVGDSKNIINDAGVIVNICNKKDMVAAIEKLFKFPTHELTALGHNGRKRVMKDYTMEMNVIKYEMLYKTLILSQKLG